ncbi:MAG: hypothetical protein ACK5LP_07710 [Campylobacteraceae bacterium]
MNKRFPYSPTYTAIAVGYKNLSYIADSVLPRVIVSKEEFKYRTFPLAEGFTIPNTLYPKKGTPNELEFASNEVTASTVDYGLSDFVSNDDIANAPENYDPLAHSTEMLTDLILLDREVRVARLLFNINSYASDKQLVLSGTDKFSSYADSDPLRVITEALESCLIRPNTLTIGSHAWSILRQHPKLIKAIHKNSGDSGIASRVAFAELLELDNVYVGQSRLNTANKGQNPTLSRVWGDDIALTYINPLANTNNGLTFGYTAQYGSKIAGTKEVDKGIRGSTEARVAESVKELIVASDAGFILKDVV